MALPIALQLYSVREDLAKDFLGTLKAVKSFGYDRRRGEWTSLHKEMKPHCIRYSITVEPTLEYKII